MARPAAPISLHALALAGALSGCYATVGPTIGFTIKGEPTLGFEAGASTLTYGKTLIYGGHPAGTERQRRVRSFWAWEPGYPFSSKSGEQLSWLALGASVGQSWEADGEKHWFGGAWTGAGHSPNIINDDGCGEDLRPYGMLLLGYRGDGFYLAPKVGLMLEPKFCLNLKF